MNNKFAIAIHGGAGTIVKSLMTDQKSIHYNNALEACLLKGYNVLKDGGNSIDAVVASVKALEDNPLFNAGRGAVFNNKGKHEMDASIMSGKDRSCGAVSGITNVKNPITLAHTIMVDSPHVFLSGEGATLFAKEHNIQFEEDSYFYDAYRYQQWQEALTDDSIRLDHSEKKMGTVGAVALDMFGNLAAATSTGGMTNKKWGRVGDSPIIGAGNWADNHTCAISCTGHGELFIKNVVAYDIACLIEYKNFTLKQACNYVVLGKLMKANAEGGLVAVDTHGNIEMPFNSEGMYRAMKSNDSILTTSIY